MPERAANAQWRHVTSFVYYTATSLNGHICDTNGSLEWLFDVGDGDQSDFASFIAGVGVQVMGSRTYEWLITNNNILSAPDTWETVFGALPTRVFTTRTLPRPRSATFDFCRGDVAEWRDELRALAEGRDVWVVGGGELAGQFYDAGMLDRIELTVAPVALDGGTPLLPRRILAESLHLEDVQRQGPFVKIAYTVMRT